jgi:hypothetical protein
MFTRICAASLVRFAERLEQVGADRLDDFRVVQRRGFEEPRGRVVIGAVRFRRRTERSEHRCNGGVQSFLLFRVHGLSVL